MASDLTTIGFASTNSDVKALAEHAYRHGRWYKAQSGHYVMWPVRTGEQVWLQVDRTDKIVGLNPHFAGPARLDVAVVEVRRDEHHVMEGSLSCWANPRGPDPESGDYPLLVDLPDFELTARALDVSGLTTLQVAAFARDLSCWTDDASYEEAEAVRWNREGSAIKGFAAESFIPSGMFALGDQADAPGPTAMAVFSGHVLGVALRTNTYSRRRFLHVTVKTLGGEYDVSPIPKWWRVRPPSAAW